ncbi:hypothetical protein BD626DRAFT_479117 [Schizophyllum amplum]|uniref:Uncharacterized protein n=1 Tax=Schizophyllum amplum TaxID=97359 RepID=A0A550CRX0_9AGAR|nr:hypothetical protein BD626DRAFT_479117 [Auriculariopsis ampla]
MSTTPSAPPASETATKTSKRVTFAASVVFKRSAKASRSAHKTNKDHSRAKIAAAAASLRSKYHRVYAIKLSDPGMRQFHDKHIGPPPEGMTEEQDKEWWQRRRDAMVAIVPSYCMPRFKLPMARPSSFLTTVREGRTLSEVVVLADNRARRKSARVPPPESLVKEVAKFIYQEGDKPQWYTVYNPGN